MRALTKAAMILTFAGFCLARVNGQAVQDPKLTGTYIAAVTGHSVGTLRIGGALLSFAMEYVGGLGYHAVSSSTGVLFFQGKRYPITLDASVPPFTSVLGTGKGGTKNQDLDFLMRANITLFNVRAWWFYGTLPFTRAKGVYFTNARTAYQADQDDFGAGNGTDPYVEFDSGVIGVTGDDYDVEAVRVSTVVGIRIDRATKVKIRR